MSVLKPYAHMALLRAFPIEAHATALMSPPEASASASSNIARGPDELSSTELDREPATRAALEEHVRALLRRLYEDGEFVGVQVAA